MSIIYFFRSRKKIEKLMNMQGIRFERAVSNKLDKGKMVLRSSCFNDNDYGFVESW